MGSQESRIDDKVPQEQPKAEQSNVQAQIDDDDEPDEW